MGCSGCEGSHLNFLRGLGARQILHRLLSAGPFFVLAVLAVIATPSAEGNKDLFWSINRFSHDGWRAVLAIFLVLAYFCAWWWTSIPTPAVNPRQQTQQRLRMFQSDLLSLRGELFQSVDDVNFDLTTKNAENLLNDMKLWVGGNISPEAWVRLSRPKTLGLVFHFNGSGFGEDQAQSRNGVINAVDGFVEGLDELIKHSGWDQ